MDYFFIIQFNWMKTYKRNSFIVSGNCIQSFGEIRREVKLETSIQRLINDNHYIDVHSHFAKNNYLYRIQLSTPRILFGFYALNSSAIQIYFTV